MTGTITREDVSIAYEVSAPEGTDTATVVLLHNIFCDRRVFDRVAAELRSRHRTIAIDFRGHGQSALGERPYDVVGADLVRIPDAGHTMTAERPVESAAAIASFLGR